jgi:hypothetical protein
MVCIWSTSVQLTWGVASLRAIIRNMHTWSSRLLKPRLQMAVSQVSKNIHKSGNKGMQSASCSDVSTPARNLLDAGSANSQKNSDQCSLSKLISGPLSKSILDSLPKPTFDGFGASNSGEDEPEISRLSHKVAPINIDKNTSPPGVKDTDICSLATALQSTKLGCVDDSCIGTADVPYLEYSEKNGYEAGRYQAITFQQCYVNYSLEELRVADYNRGRRFCSS